MSTPDGYVVGMDNLPARIWLQRDTHGEVTWCAERINDDDVEYVRAPAEAMTCPCGDGPGHGDAWCGDYECPTCGRGPKLDEAIFQAGLERGRADMAPAEATERDAMDFCPTCKHPRWTTACQCAAEATEASGEMVGWLEVAEPCTDPFHFRLDGPTGAQQCPRCGSRMKVAPASGEPSGADAVVREALDALASLFKQALYVRERDTHGAWLPDWACAECRPDSDLIEDGFRCGFHAAKAVLSANGRLPTAPGAPEVGAGE